MMWSSRVKSVLKDRWLGLCLGMWMQACGGISYVFSLYSGDLKHTLGYNQEMIDGLGTAKDIGGNVGIISGLLIDLTSAWFVLLVGGLMHSCFYFLVRFKALMGPLFLVAIKWMKYIVTKPIKVHLRCIGSGLSCFILIGIQVHCILLVSSLVMLQWDSIKSVTITQGLCLQLFLAATGKITPSYWQVQLIQPNQNPKWKLMILMIHTLWYLSTRTYVPYVPTLIWS